MIKEENLNSWLDFKDEIEKIEKEFGGKADKLLFRGQARSTWDLKTTLERRIKTPLSLLRYYQFAFTARARLETFLNISWKIPEPSEFRKWLKYKLEKSTLLNYDDMPDDSFNFLAYLRHHGFPSPFLDWTSSPFIAVFFAYDNYREDSEKDDSENKLVSVYCFLETAEIGKIRSSDKSGIHVFDPYVTVHPRHFLQQSQYSLCLGLDDTYNPIIANHNAVFDRTDPKQDRLWKFNLPYTDRDQALKYLNKMNINSYSLFGSDDSLVQSIATNEIIKNAFNKF